MSKFYKLTIKEIVRETPKAIVVTFEIPDALKSEFTFIAGQYVNIKHVIVDKEVRRAYSICSSPNTQNVSIAIKEVDNGLFSTFANSTLQAGMQLEVSTPEGRFTFNPDPSKSVFYGGIAAGSGITPIVSIAKSVMENEPNSSFVLIYGNKSAAETILYKEINNLLTQYADRFFVQYLFSQNKEANALFGRIERPTIQYIFNNKYGKRAYDTFYLCGPEEMIYSATSVLKESGFPEEKMKFELFTTSDKGSFTPVSNDTTTVTVTLDDETKTFEMSQKDNLLKALIDNGVDAPHSCLGGVCSSCICQISEGAAVMSKNSVLTDQEITSGLTLACQAYPTSNTIVLDFDNV